MTEVVYFLLITKWALLNRTLAPFRRISICHVLDLRWRLETSNDQISCSEWILISVQLQVDHRANKLCDELLWKTHSLRFHHWMFEEILQLWMQQGKENLLLSIIKMTSSHLPIEGCEWCLILHLQHQVEMSMRSHLSLENDPDFKAARDIFHNQEVSESTRFEKDYKAFYRGWSHRSN